MYSYWFSTHEQWKTLLLPYLHPTDLPLVTALFSNCETARTIDASLTSLPGLLASINDVAQPGPDQQNIPDYASACGVASIAMETIERRCVLVVMYTYIYIYLYM